MKTEGRKGRCLWDDKEFDIPPQAETKLYCGAACRARYKRAQRAVALGELVERLGPFVMDDGLEVYRELVLHLAGRINAEI